VELELERQVMVWECAIAQLSSEREDHKTIKNLYKWHSGTDVE
jgi:hypothetical protein